MTNITTDDRLTLSQVHSWDTQRK